MEIIYRQKIIICRQMIIICRQIIIICRQKQYSLPKDNNFRQNYICFIDKVFKMCMSYDKCIMQTKGNNNYVNKNDNYLSTKGNYLSTKRIYIYIFFLKCICCITFMIFFPFSYVYRGKKMQFCRKIVEIFDNTSFAESRFPRKSYHLKYTGVVIKTCINNFAF